MRRATLTAAAALLAAIATAAPAPVANQLWVTNKINEVTGTNTAAKIAAATNATLAAANAYTDAAIDGAGGLTPQTATNIAANVVVRDVPAWARSATPPESGVDTNAVKDIVADAVSWKQDKLEVLAGGEYNIFVSQAYTADSALSATKAENDAYDRSIVGTYATKDGLSSVSNTVAAWTTYWDGDDVRVTVTNYDSAVNIPSLYLEQRTNETATTGNAFKTVWREMAHWDAFLGTDWSWRSAWGGFQTWKTNITAQIEQKADRAWGFYDSHTGDYSPDGYTVISSSNVMIAAGMSYQKTLTTSAEVWILTANEPYEPTGIAMNGGFSIKDSDGVVQFEIVKGDKVTVAAQPSEVTTEEATPATSLVVTYNIIASEHPTAQVCLDLAAANWKTETDADCPATVTWTGESGAYVATITPNTETTACFMKATYQRGGDTYINNRCAVGMSQLVLGGVTYNLGTATIDGHTVLTLTPAN